jgi:adenylate cyclase
MLAFPNPQIALEILGRLLPACRAEPKLPLTRCGISHGRVIRRSNDIFGSTVNIAARITALSAPGQLLTTQVVAETAREQGIDVKDLGPVGLRSVASALPLFSLEMAPAPDRSWIDPVCKMHPPFGGFKLVPRDMPWFCSQECEDAYRKSPAAYPMSRALGS